MRRILLILEYDGTNYRGWQSQKNLITVQQTLTSAIEKACGHEVVVHASGRTDVGVHALGQAAHFDTSSTIPAAKFMDAINIRLPSDIKIVKSIEVDSNFHARISAKKKTYLYKIYANRIPSPIKRLHSAYIPYSLDAEKMNKACQYFLGEHDFTAFMSTGSTVKSAVRTIYDAKVYEEDGFICFEVTGNGFLYNMVRIMTGALIDVGKGKKPPEKIMDIILCKSRKNAGKTAPAEGLYLKSVDYS